MLINFKVSQNTHKMQSHCQKYMFYKSNKLFIHQKLNFRIAIYMLQEWEGNTSSKFGRTKKIIGLTTEIVSEMPGLLGETNIGLERLKGRRHFEASECQTVKD